MSVLFLNLMHSMICDIYFFTFLFVTSQCQFTTDFVVDVVGVNVYTSTQFNILIQCKSSFEWNINLVKNSHLSMN